MTEPGSDSTVPKLGCAVVVGTGNMAPGLAAACSIAGLEVVVVGRDPAKASTAAAQASEFARRRVRDPAEVRIAAAELDRGAFARAELVIETIVEDVQAKSDLYRLIGPWLRPEAILATNTSSFLIGSLAASVADPSRFAGLHFLNPAHETAVVEVIRGPATADDIALALAELGRRMGKTPLLVRRDIEGFIWNRIQHAVLRECLHLLDQGIADIASIDAAVSDGLAPRWVAAGPFATADLGNIETWRIVASQLFPALSSSSEVQASLVDRVASGRGFYRWEEESRRDLAALRGEIVRALEPTIERRRRAMRAADDGADR